MNKVEKPNCVATPISRHHSEMEQQLIQFAPASFSNTTNLQVKNMGVDQEWSAKKTQSVPLLALYTYERRSIPGTVATSK